MLYKALQNLVKNGMTEELREKIDTLYALGRITDSQYHALIEE